MSTMERDNETVQQLHDMPWTAYVGETRRDCATHVVKTHLTLIRTNHERRQIENLGVEIESIGVAEHGRAQLFVRV